MRADPKLLTETSVPLPRGPVEVEIKGPGDRVWVNVGGSLKSAACGARLER